MYGILVLLFTLGCVEDVGKDKVAATVEEVPAAHGADAAKTETPATAAAAPAGSGKELQIDKARSKINALGAKISAKHPIDFHDYTGSVTLNGDVPTAVKFDVQIKTITSDNEKLTGHLLNEDFFYAEKYPNATFTSTAVTPGGTGGTHTVEGDLTIRGVTKRVTFPATITVGASEVTANTEFVINRQDFGITYPGKADDLVQDNVVLTVNLVAPRA